MKIEANRHMAWIIARRFCETEKKLDRKDNSIDEVGTSNISKHNMHRKIMSTWEFFFLNPRFTCTKSHRIITSVQ